MQVSCSSIKDNLPIPLKNILMCFIMTHFNKAQHHQKLSVFLFVLPLDIVNIFILIIYSVLNYSVFPWRVSKNFSSYQMKFRESAGHKSSIEKILSPFFSICFYFLYFFLWPPIKKFRLRRYLFMKVDNLSSYFQKAGHFSVSERSKLEFQK